MLQILRRRRALAMALTAAAASASIAYGAGSGPLYASASGGGGAASSGGGGAANIHLFTPNSGDRAGLESKGFFIDLKADIDLPLERSGFGGQAPRRASARTSASPVSSCSCRARRPAPARTSPGCST
jgi:hypothetical protein